MKALSPYIRTAVLIACVGVIALPSMAQNPTGTLTGRATADGESLLDAVPVHKDPPCQDCPFRDGPCPRGYRQLAHGLH